MIRNPLSYIWIIVNDLNYDCDNVYSRLHKFRTHSIRDPIYLVVQHLRVGGNTGRLTRASSWFCFPQLPIAKISIVSQWLYILFVFAKGKICVVDYTLIFYSFQIRFRVMGRITYPVVLFVCIVSFCFCGTYIWICNSLFKYLNSKEINL